MTGPKVFPARAGMNLGNSYDTVRWMRVPRPRGDEPVPVVGERLERGCSPPARG